MNASIIATYLLSKADPSIGDFLTNLKLQKLTYYAQGLHLALYETPLFDDPIEAWTHGPVVPTLYYEYKKYGNSPIELPANYDPSEHLTQEHQDFLDEVYEVYGQFSAWKLRNMTHEESPWLDTPQNGVISHEKLQEFFQTQIL